MYASHVLCSGRVKTKTWNAVNGMSSMEVVWVSQVITKDLNFE